MTKESVAWTNKNKNQITKINKPENKLENWKTTGNACITHGVWFMFRPLPFFPIVTSNPRTHKFKQQHIHFPADTHCVCEWKFFLSPVSLVICSRHIDESIHQLTKLMVEIFAYFSVWAMKWQQHWLFIHCQ